LISHGVPPLGGVKQGRGGKTSYFRAKCINIWKTVRDIRPKFLLVANALSIGTKIDDLG